MKKIITILLLGFFLTLGCTKESINKTEIPFKTNISAFNIEKTTFKSKTTSSFDKFEHQYPTNTDITFALNTANVTYCYNTGDSTLQTKLFSLPVGEYTVTGNGGDDSHVGKPTMKYTIKEQIIKITDTTTQINLTLTPKITCILIYDPDTLLEEYSGLAIIGHVFNHLYIQNNLLYSYFLPTEYGIGTWEERVLLLHKKDGSYLTCPTNTFDIGYMYRITIVSNPTPSNIAPNFENGKDITF